MSKTGQQNSSFNAATVKNELRQLQAALLQQQQVIEWRMWESLSPEQVKKNVKTFKVSSIVGGIFLIVIGIFLLQAMDDMFSGAVMVVFGIADILVLGPMLGRLIARNDFRRFDVKLDTKKQCVVFLVRDKQRLKLKFHSGKTLPVFALPPDADAETQRLRDDVQQRLSNITGLSFA